jgi:uncharacterized membrane protein YhiD involved in acid resistance
MSAPAPLPGVSAGLWIAVGWGVAFSALLAALLWWLI